MGEVHLRAQGDFVFIKVAVQGLHAGKFNNADHVASRENLGHSDKFWCLGQKIWHGAVVWHLISHGVGNSWLQGIFHVFLL